MKKGLVYILITIVILSLGGVAFAATFNTTGNPGDTPAGTLITSEGIINDLQYLDAAGNPKATIESNDITLDVSPESGFSSSNTPATLTRSTAPGGALSWLLAITNEGNQDETLTLTQESIIYTGGASNWTAVFTHMGSDTSEVVTTLSDDDDEFITITITPSGDETESPDGSTGSIEAWAYLPLAGPNTGSGTGGIYTGANAYTYGGATITFDNYQADIMAPVMSISRVSTVDAPTSSEAYQTGNIHAAIPGSLWIYTIEYENTGSGTAESVVIYDKVPDNCRAYKTNIQNPEPGSPPRVIITAPTETATGWNIYQSTDDTPGWGYGNTAGWTFAGTVGAEHGLNIAAKWIKWEKASVAPAENETLQWCVDIR